jgi:hypothetical protein
LCPAGVAPDLADLALEIRVSSPSPQDRIDAMLAAWRERCPIYLALIKPQSVTLTIAGRPIGPQVTGGLAIFN